MIERCDWKFNALKTYLRINLIHLNACKIEKIQILDFFTSACFNKLFLLREWGMVEVRGPRCARHCAHTKYMSYPLPECLFAVEDWIAERLNASLVIPQEIYGRVLKWTQHSQVPDECLNQNLTLPYHTLFLFLSNIFSKHFFCLVHWGQWSQLVASTTEFRPLCFFPLYIAYILSC